MKVFLHFCYHFLISSGYLFRCYTSSSLKCFFSQSSSASILSKSQFKVFILLNFSACDPIVHSFLLETFQNISSENLPGNLSISFTNFSSTSRLLIVVMFLGSALGPLFFSVFTHLQVLSSILSALNIIPMLMNPKFTSLVFTSLLSSCFMYLTTYFFLFSGC